MGNVSYIEMFSTWEKWIYKNYIFDPLKKTINDKVDLLSNLNKKINSKNGHKWLKRKLALDYRSLRSNSVAKKITVKSKQLVFNAFKVLSVFNIFTFIGSFLIEYLIYSDEVDEIFEAYKEGYKKGTKNRDRIDKVLSITNQSVAEVINYLCSNYKVFLKNSEVDKELKTNLKGQLITTNKRLDNFFIGLNKYGSDDERALFPNYASFQTIGNIKGIEPLTLGLSPAEHIIYRKDYTKGKVRKWLLYNSNDSVYNVGYISKSYPGPRDNDYLGPESIKLYEKIADYCEGRYWKRFLGYSSFAISQVYGELYRLGIWDYSLEEKVRTKILKEINSIIKEKNALSSDKSMISKIDLNINFTKEHFVNNEITKGYLELIGFTLTEEIKSMTIKNISVRINQDYDMSSPHSALYDITYNIKTKTKEESITYTNTRNILDDL